MTIAVSSTAARVAASQQTSRVRSMSENGGPMDSARSPGSGGAIMTGGAKGVLKQMNVGDVKSSVDSSENAVTTSTQKVKMKTEQATQAIGAQFSGKGGKVSVTS